MKKFTLIMALSAASFAATAQPLMGIATSNWSGPMGLALNPANIADSRTRFAVNLFSLNFGLDNNLASLDLSTATSNLGSTSDVGSLFALSNSNSFNILMPYASVTLPGIMVSIDDKNSFALTTKFRGINQFHHFSQDLFSSVLNPSYNNDVAIASKNFNWTANAWTEFKLTYAREVYNVDKHYVKAGITISRLGGLGFLSLKGKNLDGRFYAAQDSLVTTNTDLQFATSLIDNGQSLVGGLGDVTGQFLGKKGGKGWGLDIGAVYEYRTEETDNDDQSSNKYKVRGSVAITDMGSIKYTSFEAKISANGSMLTDDIADTISQSGGFSNYARSRGYTMDTGRVKAKVHLPTVMIIGADYYVASHFYVNATLMTNMTNRTNYGNSMYGQLTVTPRWDTRFFCAAIPLTYSSMTKKMKAGLGLRAGGFFFGSDDMLLFLGGKAYGMNFYAGAYVPINKKRSKAQKDLIKMD